MLELSINHIKMKYYEDIILKDVHFDVMTGDKIGLIGNNGCGKSTLLKLIIGEEHYIDGSIHIRKGLKIGYLAQFALELYDLSVSDVLYLPFRDILSTEQMLRELECQMAEDPSNQQLLEKYSHTLTQYEVLGGYDYELKITQIIEALKLSPLLLQSFNQLSGGEKTRISLAKILLESPDLLLLDEPTNHLDIDMLSWLEDYIATNKGAVIMVSHDRYFLDQVTDKIIEIRSGHSRVFFGNYSFYQLEKEKIYEREVKSYQHQQSLIKNIQAAIKRFREWGERGDNKKFFNKAGQFQKRLDTMSILERPKDGVQHFNIAIANNKKSSKRMIIVDDANKSFDSRTIFKNINFEILRGEKVCIMGANGVGKSTLIKSIRGEIELSSGQIATPQSAKIGYLAQEIIFDDDNMTLVDFVSAKAELIQGQARNLLAQYGFKGQDVFKRIGTLSGGEKSRIILMLFSQNNYNLMLLDEPTNHLDLQSKEKLEDELDAFDSTICFISHDRYFINRIATRILYLEDDKITSYDGNYDDFYRIHQNKKSHVDNHPKKAVKPKQINKKSNNKYKKAELEQKIEALEIEISQLRDAQQHNASDYKKLESLLKEIDKKQKQVDNLIELFIAID